MLIMKNLNSASGSRLVKLKKKGPSETRNSLVKPPSLCRVKVVMEAPEIEDYHSDKVRGLKLKNIRKKKKKPRFPNKSLNSEFSINPRTVRERLKNLSVFEDYNHNHEDDIFECIDTSSMHTNVLLNCSSSSSGISSPVLSRRASPSPLPKLTRESTPLRLRGLLNSNKDETIVSGNSFARISFINRKLKKHKVLMKNQIKSRRHDGLSMTEEDKTPCCEELLKTALKGFVASERQFDDDEGLSDLESYFTDEEINEN